MDTALSGALPALERPRLRAMLGAVQEGDKAVVLRLDRIARDLYLSLWAEKEIRKTGAELISISEPSRWNDPMQKLLLNTMQVTNGSLTGEPSIKDYIAIRELRQKGSMPKSFDSGGPNIYPKRQEARPL